MPNLTTAESVDSAVVNRIVAYPRNVGAHLASELRGGGRFSGGDRLVVALMDSEVCAFATFATLPPNLYRQWR